MAVRLIGDAGRLEMHETCVKKACCFQEVFEKEAGNREPKVHSGRWGFIRKRPRCASQWLRPGEGAATANRKMKLVLPAWLLAVIV
jgi:hypothetical protein